MSTESSIGKFPSNDSYESVGNDRFISVMGRPHQRDGVPIKRAGLCRPGSIRGAQHLSQSPLRGLRLR
ncbi:hypothetical protein GCM10010924_52240 [Rhizobium wenxiniae]|nr:hypothetical protein GCM10010924_52240 [Rhizobium wenxiniae]